MKIFKWHLISEKDIGDVSKRWVAMVARLEDANQKIVLLQEAKDWLESVIKENPELIANTEWPLKPEETDDILK
jgi:hypothetical protein